MNEVKEPEYVYVALYTNRNGESVRVFRTEASAWKWADSIARDKWDEWYSLDEPMPTEDIGKAYFGNMDTYYDGEFFELGRCVIREDEA